MPFSFLGKLLSLFRMSEEPVYLPSSLHSPQRKPVKGWCDGVLIAVEETVACSEFYLTKIWHWERTELFKHEGLTFEFMRDRSARVYIKVDRCSYDNDPYVSSIKALNISSGPTITESKDQNSDTSLTNAKDWVQVLTRDELSTFFCLSPPNILHDGGIIRSLGTTDFTRRPNSIPAPNLVDVMLVVKAVSEARQEYEIWQANCWWLARSLRMFIEDKWNRKPDYTLPNIVIAGFDTGVERIIQDQPKIQRIYEVEDAKRIEVLTRKINMDGALQRADDAERESREEREARLQVEAKLRQAEAEARAERKARIAAENSRIAAEERAAKLEAQLRNAGIDSPIA